MKQLNILKRIFFFEEDEEGIVKPIRRELKWSSFKILNSKIKIERMHLF